MTASTRPTPASIGKGSCPFPHENFSQQKTAPVFEPQDKPIETDAFGIWHIRSFELARSLLRSETTKQAGFGAELIGEMPSYMRPPILFLEGQPHHEQRRQTARFFTPRTTDTRYRAFMEAYADELIAELMQKGTADLSDLSMRMAVQVASQVVGLTDSRVPGMDRRLDRFFKQDPGQLGWSFGQIKGFLRNQWDLSLFFLLDVRPAIKVRQLQRQEDVISHLLDHEYSNTEILTECVTYAAAGMVTTREFICVVMWHCLENPEYRQLMLTAGEEERYAFLHELLRLEPVVGRLYRRATADIQLDHNGIEVTIPKGALIDLHTYATNADTAVVGDTPLRICPGRDLAPMKPKPSPALLSFGDGAHRCPGAYIAIQETDIFVRKLLEIPSLYIAREPDVQYNELAKGYELRNFVLALP